MRSLDHSTIVYESPSKSAAGTRISSTNPMNAATPLLRISPCSKDANLLATFHLDSSSVLVLDVRQPGKELFTLTAHTGNVNAGTPARNKPDAVQWAPASRHVLVSGGDDHQALIWDLSRVPSGGRSHGGTIRDPILAYTTESEINNLYPPRKTPLT
jgi:DDB1- and CUL4-associated factor 7